MTIRFDDRVAIVTGLETGLVARTLYRLRRGARRLW